MTGGEKALVVGVVGLGVLALFRFRSAHPSSPPATTTGKITGSFADPGPVVPGLAPIYSLLKPIANNVTTPAINKLNKTIGGVTLGGAPKNIVYNSDGTVDYDDGVYRFRQWPDGHRQQIGTAKRDYVGQHVYTAAKAVVALGSGVISDIKGWF